MNSTPPAILCILAYRRIGDALGRVDGALPAVPDPHTAACGDAGVAHLDELVRNVQGMRLIGPNRRGLTDLSLRLALTSMVGLECDATPPLNP